MYGTDPDSLNDTDWAILAADAMLVEHIRARLIALEVSKLFKNDND